MQKIHGLKLNLFSKLDTLKHKLSLLRKWLKKTWKKLDKKWLWTILLLGIILFVLIFTSIRVLAAREHRLEQINNLEVQLTEVSEEHSETKEQLELRLKREKELKRQIERLEARKQANAVYAQSEPVTPLKAPSGSCTDWIKQAGVEDVDNAYALIMRESGCNPRAVNSSSGACGIPQNINGCTFGYDPIAQIKWMQNYVFERYRSWAAANQFQLANNYY